MTETKIKKVLKDLDITPGVITQTDKIKTILMTTNFGYDIYRDRILFDLDDMLVKIKQYHYKNRSGLIDPSFVLSADRKVLSLESSKLYIGTEPWPKAGSYIGLLLKIKPEEGLKATYEIKNCGRYFIELNEAISENLSNYTLVYFLDNPGNLVQSIDDPLKFFEYKPYTENVADVYLDINYIFGFEFSAKKIGNS